MLSQRRSSAVRHLHFVSQDYESGRLLLILIIVAALLLQSSLVPAHDIQLPDAELELDVFNNLINDLNAALERGVCREVIAAINVR